MKKLSKTIKEIKENTMLAIHERPINISLEELAEHNKRIDDAIKEIEKGEGTIKEV